MTDDATIDLGRAAWKRIQHHARKKSFEDWIKLGRALLVGRCEAMKAAGTNKPVGNRYNMAMNSWLTANGMHGVNANERYKIFSILENLDAVQRWLDGIGDAERRRMQHPSTIWAGYRRHLAPRSRCYTCPPRPSTKLVDGRYHRQIKFDQAMIRRAGDAMRQSWSNDCYRLAAIALIAAIRDERDILELLPDPPKPSPRLAAPIAEHATA